MPKVSIVIPCYNQGMFLDEAVDSARSQTFDDYEIVIVDDGSDDEETSKRCQSYDDPRIRSIRTTNQGLAAARNNGIRVAAGEYILPLDADDKIGKDYLREAVPVLDNNKDAGIVYCKARLFGAVETDWLLPGYSLDQMLKDNIIFCSALYRRKDWELVGGYDPGMIYGWEDYDFWLSLIERQRTVVQLPDTHFFYRVSPDSMVRSKERWQKIAMFKRIYQRHTAFIGDNVEIWLQAILAHKEPVLTSRLYVNEGRGINDQSSIAKEITEETKDLIFDLARFTDRKEIRFDPVDCPVCLDMHSVELLGENSVYRLDLDKLRSNALVRSGNLFRFETDDPQIYFPLSEKQLQGADRVRIVFDIRSLQEQALREIINHVSSTQGSKTRRSTLNRWFSPEDK